jgi:phosphoribosylformylglycinamidine synthase
MGLGVGAIGGKDSMSGSFEKLDVPPTLVSFATAIGRADRVVGAAFSQPGSSVVLLSPAPGDGPVPDYESQKRVFEAVEHLIAAGSVRAAASVGLGGVAEAVFKMGLGNRIGFALEDADLTEEDLFAPRYGSFVLELAEGVIVGRPLGRTTAEYRFAAFGEKLNSAWLQELWERRLEPVFPYRSAGDVVKTVDAALSAPAAAPHIGIAKPRVVIPVFPGTNCEYDTARAFARAGAEPNVLVVNNLTPAAVAESCAALVKAIRESQIVFLPGGFSGGDEPDGSAKFITAFFRAPAVPDAVPWSCSGAARRPDAGHLQRLPGPHQAGPGALRRHPTRIAAETPR